MPTNMVRGASGKVSIQRSGSYGRDAEVVVPADTGAFIKGTCIGIYVGVSGDVTIPLGDGTAYTFKSVPAGSILPMETTRVNTTGTTATNMVAIFE